MKYEKPLLEFIELKIKDVILQSENPDGDSLFNGGEGDGEGGDFNQFI